MGVRGDFAELAKLRAAFRQASSGDLRSRLLKAAASEALTQVQLEFRESVDPTGQAWAPLKYRDGMPLRDTGRMANSFTSKPTGNGFMVGTNVAYAVYHQKGTKGRKAAQTRMQAVGKNGRFMSRLRAGKAKSASVGVRSLTFKAGSGGIPARPMVPEGGLTARWRKPIEAAVDGAFKKFWSRLTK